MLDAFEVIEYPHLTEKSINNIEVQNKLVFIVKRTANKADVKKAVQDAFDVKVKKVNVLTTTKGLKKAIVSLDPKYSAVDIATKLGMM
ncbi:MAG: 50S ribosomal protein L23 [Candidatus Aenigmarchaeota archaeon]|nr:50S ribosomal protein L23 [Candidatus Aenigmarchaeota archaeon]